MNKNFKSRESDKLIKWVKLNSVIEQLTFLALPLTIYMIYNIVLSNKNINITLFITSFLVAIITIQFIIKIFESAQRNIIKLDEDVKLQRQNLESNLEQETRNIEKTISSLNKMNVKVNENIHNQLSNTYNGLMIFYFCSIIAIGKYLVLIPIIFFSVNYYLVEFLNFYIKYHANRENVNSIKESIYIKDVLRKFKVIKSLTLEEFVVDSSSHLIAKTNLEHSKILLYRNLIQRINIIFNILNIAFIVLFGRYLFGLGVLTTEQVVTCSILTIWAARLFAHILLQNFKQSYRDQSVVVNDCKDHVEVTNLSDNKKIAKDFKQQIENDGVAYISGEIFKSIKDLDLGYERKAYINNDISLFYGTILDNITLFDSSKDEKAISLIKSFRLQHLISNLPYSYNYVVTGKADETIPFELMLGIAVVREIIHGSRILLIDFDCNRMNRTFKNDLINYARMEGLVLVIRKSDIQIKELMLNVTEPYIGKSKVKE